MSLFFYSQFISLQVLYEKPNEFAAQFKFTVLLMHNRQHKITGIPLDLDIYQSEYAVKEPELKVWFKCYLFKFPLIL